MQGVSVVLKRAPHHLVSGTQGLVAMKATNNEQLKIYNLKGDSKIKATGTRQLNRKESRVRKLLNL